MFAVWERDSGGLGYAMYIADTLFASGSLPGVASNAFRPTMAHYPGSTSYRLAWREGTAIRYKEVIIDPNIPDIIFYTTEQVNNPLEGDESAVDGSAPSIAVANYSELDSLICAVVAWEAREGSGLRHAVARLKIFTGWSPVEHLWPPPPTSGSQDTSTWAPSAMALDIPPNPPNFDAIRVATNWSDGADPILVFILSNGDWSLGQQGTYEILHPSTVPFPPAGKAIAILPDRSVPSRFSGRFTSIHTSSDFLNKKIALERSRELVLTRDTTNASLLIGGMSLETGGQTSRLEWNRGFDTLIVGMTSTLEEEIRTAPFDISQGMRLHATLADGKRGNQTFGDSLYLRVQLVRASNDQLLHTLGQYHPRTMAQGRRRVEVNQNLNAFAGERVYLRMSLAGCDTSVSMYARDFYTSPGLPIPKFGGEETEPAASTLPESFALGQNHPNPFRGRTEIPFAVAEPGRVRLSVHDLLGREVRVIKEAESPAGHHTAIWNAGDLPPGIYFYRLRTEKGYFIRKMCLLR